MGITVRELVTKLTVDDGSATTKLARFGLAVNGITAALNIMVAGLEFAKRATIGLILEISQQADALDKTAASTGLTTQAFQRLGFIAEQTGTPMTNLIKATQNVGRNMRDAALAGEGKGSFNIALKQIGLTIEDLVGLDFPTQLGIMADALNKLTDPAQRVALSQKLIGEEAGPKMAALLAGGSAAIQKLTKDFEDLGGATSAANIKAGVDLVGALTSAKTAIALVRLEVLELAPRITALVEQFIEWFKVNREIIRSKLLKFFGAVIDGFESLAKSGGDWFKLITDLVKLLFKFIEVGVKFTKGLLEMKGVVIGTAAAFVTLKLGILAMTGPVGALAALVIVAASAFALLTGNIDEAERARSTFGEEKGKAEELSRTKIKLFSKALNENIFFGKTVPNELINALAGASNKSLNRVFSDVAHSLKQSELDSVGLKGGAGPRALRQGRLSVLQQQIAQRRVNNRRLADAPQRRKDIDARFEASAVARDRKKAIDAEFNALKNLGRKGGGAKADKEPDVTDAELLQLINQAAQTGQSLTGLIGKRGIPGGVPPVIAMTINTINQENTIDIHVDGDGVDGSALEDKIMERLDQERQIELRQAVEALQPSGSV